MNNNNRQQQRNNAPRVRKRHRFYKDFAETRGFFYPQNTLTAVLIDGDFFLKRFRKLSTSFDKENPEYVARAIKDIAIKHVIRINSSLYRIFFYDCKPFDERRHNPISNKSVDFRKLPEDKPVYEFRNKLHDEIRKTPKTALRLVHHKS